MHSIVAYLRVARRNRVRPGSDSKRSARPSTALPRPSAQRSSTRPPRSRPARGGCRPHRCSHKSGSQGHCRGLQARPARPRRAFHFGSDGSTRPVHRYRAGRGHRPIHAAHYAALAEKERRRISERTKAGRPEARSSAAATPNPSWRSERSGNSLSNYGRFSPS